MDVADQVTVLPEHAAAWLGRPGLEGGRAGRDWSTAFRVGKAGLSGEPEGDQRLVVEAADPVASLTLDLEIELAATGLLRLRAGLRNDGPDPFSVGALRLVLPVPSQAVELMDFAGRSVMERLPQRLPFPYGVHSRESRMGRPGHSSAYLLMARHPGFRVPARRGLGHPPRLERQPEPVRRADLQRGARPRRRRAARAGRGQVGAREPATEARGPTPATARAWTPSPHVSTGPCGPARSIRVRPGRSWSTPGRPCTSTIADEAEAAGRPGGGGWGRAVRARRRLVLRSARRHEQPR